MPSITFSFEV
ncbi:hypothetical protein VTL71DRAFT_9486 [Oculimacula yallundae]|uniref:Uncharacterized protein n=1 Tax=Oculimacula yallundae TaxID=86028 RepID=A0ABR4BS19_9HELO